MFENDSNTIRNVITDATSAAETLYPDDLSNLDDKLSDNLTLIRSFYIRNYTLKKLEELGMPLETELEDMSDIQDLILSLKNISYGIGTKMKEDETQPADIPNQPTGSTTQPNIPNEPSTSPTPPDTPNDQDGGPDDDSGNSPTPPDEVIL